MKLALERQIQLAFIFGLILLAVIGIFAYQSVNSLNTALKWEKHTQDVLLQLDETMVSIVNAETAGRGFLITGDDSYLEPYIQTGRNINGTLSQLRLLVADNPQQTERVNSVESLINEKYDLLKRSVELRRTQDIESVRNQLAKNRGRDLMNEIRSLIGEMKNTEKNLLIEREGDLDGSVKTTQTMLLLGSFAGILSLGLANSAIFREVGKRRRAENKIRDSNKGWKKESRKGRVKFRQKIKN